MRDQETEQRVRLQDMIPMETRFTQSQLPDGPFTPKLVVGHNVGFDRSFIKEQYYIQVTFSKS